MGFFSSRLVDPEIAEWQFEYFEILIKNFSSGPGLPDSDLILPVPEQFNPPGTQKTLEGRQLAEFLFSVVKQQCGFAPDTQIKLIPLEETRQISLGGTAMIKTEGDIACGRYFIEMTGENTYEETITYDRALEDNPMELVATLAHELSHALHNRSRTPIDIEPELYELFTDLTAIYLGYGIFLANSRFEYTQFQDGEIQGWQTRGAGYLSEADMMFATGLFMRIKNISPKTAMQFLKPKLQKMLIKAFKQLRQHETEIEFLQNMNPARIQTDSNI